MNQTETPIFQIICNGIRYHYTAKGHGNLTFLFIHNTGGDHRLFMPQLNYFSQFGQVLIPDLRGHGKSEKPNKKYSIETYSDDLIWLCKELSMQNVIAIGSSTGGNIALNLACTHPQLIKASVMIDCAMFLNTHARKKIREYQENMRQKNISPVIQEILEDSCLPTDQYKELMREAYLLVPAYVWEKSFASLLKWDRKNHQRLQTCKIPLLYIQACSPCRSN
jgi:pimeloyl-ACP methyl ester carboxylesterase